MASDPENPEWTEADFAAAKGPEHLLPELLAAFPRTKPRGRPVGSPAFWTSRAVTALTLALMGALLAVWVARFLGAFGGPAPV